MTQESIHEALKAAPPISVGGLALFGVSLNDWVMVCTLIYTAFLIIDKLPTVVQRVKEFIKWLKS